MSDSKKKRMAMLDTLAAAGSPAPPPSMSTSRPLRAARDAVDSHKVWDLDPYHIIDDRIADRLDPTDIDDLRASIEATGQTVPILVRRHPSEKDRYLLVYGRRRLEAIRRSDSVQTIKALIANLDQDHAVEAQISENMARRDLSYIEKALFAHELIESGFGNQIRVAEVLTVTKSSISMALGIISAVGPELVRAIGPAHSVGRPRWDALGQAIEAARYTPQELIDIAENARDARLVDAVIQDPEQGDLSVEVFEALWSKLAPPAPQKPSKAKAKPKAQALTTDGKIAGSLSRTSTGLRVELQQGPFADWLETQMQDVLDDLHTRFNQRNED
ncbi:plasmid partitioning protein RepB [Planktotalea sp.]|uniref:plasmid partitioning protein RepB n=1 Tax=Planktotalea sp. TaxID=2029877 RepID=UPI003D6AED2E